MNFKFNYSLLNHNSFSIDVKAKKFIEVKSTEELKEVLSISGDENKLIIGEGSNILFTKNFEGLVIHLNIGGIVINKIDNDYRIVTAGAGENWAVLKNNPKFVFVFEIRKFVIFLRAPIASIEPP